MAIKFKYLSEIEDQALALIDLERNKETIRTSVFSRTQYKNGKIDVSPDNSKNAELIESMVKGIIYGQKYLQNDNLPCWAQCQYLIYWSLSFERK
jgi:hypothetical protein